MSGNQGKKASKNPQAKQSQKSSRKKDSPPSSDNTPKEINEPVKKEMDSSNNADIPVKLVRQERKGHRVPFVLPPIASLRESTSRQEVAEELAVSNATFTSHTVPLTAGENPTKPKKKRKSVSDTEVISASKGPKPLIADVKKSEKKDPLDSKLASADINPPVICDSTESKNMKKQAKTKKPVIEFEGSNKDQISFATGTQSTSVKEPNSDPNKDSSNVKPTIKDSPLDTNVHLARVNPPSTNVNTPSINVKTNAPTTTVDVSSNRPVLPGSASNIPFSREALTEMQEVIKNIPPKVKAEIENMSNIRRLNIKNSEIDSYQTTDIESIVERPKVDVIIESIFNPKSLCEKKESLTKMIEIKNLLKKEIRTEKVDGKEKSTQKVDSKDSVAQKVERSKEKVTQKLVSKETTQKVASEETLTQNVGLQEKSKQKIKCKGKSTQNVENEWKDTPKVEIKVKDAQKLDSKSKDTPNVECKLKYSSKESKVQEAHKVERKVRDAPNVESKGRDAPTVESGVTDSSKVESEITDSSKFERKVKDAPKLESEVKDSSKVDRKMKDSSKVDIKVKDPSKLEKKVKDVTKVESEVKETSKERKVKDASKERKVKDKQNAESREKDTITSKRNENVKQSVHDKDESTVKDVQNAEMKMKDVQKVDVKSKNAQKTASKEEKMVGQEIKERNMGKLYSKGKIIQNVDGKDKYVKKAESKDYDDTQSSDTKKEESPYNLLEKMMENETEKIIKTAAKMELELFRQNQEKNRKLDRFSKPSSVLESNIFMHPVEINKTTVEKKMETIPKSGQAQVRVLTLNSGDHLKESLFRLQKGFILQIRPGPSLFGKKINVFTNFPKSAKDSFKRANYRKIEWESDSISRGDDTALFVRMDIHTAGSYHFYLTLNEQSEARFAVASGYFLVDPVLTTGIDGEVLPLDSIQCETFLSKCLGPLDRWEKTLRVAKEAGYNMVHFTPIQALGGSRSGYSLQDQLLLNPEFSPPGKTCDWDDVKEIVDMMDKQWKVLSITDIVLNHTANESKWLKEHPEVTYNLVNSPHLRPAYILDRVIHHFTMQIARDEWASCGVPKELIHEDQVKALEVILKEVLLLYRVHEYFLVDIEHMVDLFRSEVVSQGKAYVQGLKYVVIEPLHIIPASEWGRFNATVDIELATFKFNVTQPDRTPSGRIPECCLQLENYLKKLNLKKHIEIHDHLMTAIGCILGTVRYERMQEDGPKIPKVSREHPLVPQYFTHPGEDADIKKEEKDSFGENANFIMAHNGWVMGDDPLSDFAAPESNVFLRRELNAWGDSVKLRFGKSPLDNPYLWGHMRRYVEMTAEIFHGIRLDNCHSTPIHVAEYLLDCARKIRPDLYVVAELFTSSDKTDNVFVNRVGINSLIREALSAPDSHEEGRLVYRYGGETVGAFMLPPVRPLVPSTAHAIFLDITHDNQSPCKLRTAWDMLPSTALVNMACCATGSTRGYDEIVPHHIHVVNEERKYLAWSDDGKGKRGSVTSSTGIIGAKRILNDLHFDLGRKGFSQVFVDQVTEHVVAVTRHNPVTHESVVLVAYTSFRPPSHISNGYLRPLTVQGKLEEILFELKAKSDKESDKDKQLPGSYKRDKEYINGIDGFTVEIRKNLQPKDSLLVRRVSADGDDTSKFEYTSEFTPGSVIAFKLSLMEPSRIAIEKVRSVLSTFSYKQKMSEIEAGDKDLLEIIKQFSLSDLNRILYRCEDEEKDEGRGWNSYNVPDFGSFVYCGLQGLNSVMSNIRVENDLGHPICKNLRDGDWLMEYVVGRLRLENKTKKLASWLENQFHLLKQIPRYLIPAYFDAIITAVYLTTINHAWSLMSPFIKDGSDFAKSLALCSVQFCGVVKSALLPKLSPNLKSPRPPVEQFNNQDIETSITLSAGLPHFSVGYLRNWGRDTFIALPGNLIVTGRWQEARWVILAFAGTLRHGLIPNLLDGGAKARFNCRDAVWFWMYSIQQYIEKVQNGCEILKDKVSRLFPEDSSDPQSPGSFDQLLEDVIQEALQRHFQGVQFRERNAGFKIDSQMTDQGFNNEIGVRLETGFPFGGNENNCGTWMDKMGSSDKAGNKGKPATPRDGSAVEIVGLCKATVRFLAKMFSEGKFTYKGVTRKDSNGIELTWSYAFWNSKIQDNFSKHFWVATDSKSPHANHKMILKDTVGASSPWADYQLRCNFPIALAVAPELVTTFAGSAALEVAERFLLGPLGIKTLDPGDWAYRGDYDNSNDSEDSSVAHGFNYHQGPEWVWPVGFLLRAKLANAVLHGSKSYLENIIADIKSYLSTRYTHMLSSSWKSLPELTNRDGSFCRDSNPAQSWSTGCLLEVLWDLHQANEQLNRL